MDIEHFNMGIRHLEIMFDAKPNGERKGLYFKQLRDIPNDLWDAGIARLANGRRFPRFPLIAEIGEACVPGQAETEDLDPWTRRWVKTLTPWPVRLAHLIQPVLAPPSPQLQIPGPRDPLSASEQALLAMVLAPPDPSQTSDSHDSLSEAEPTCGPPGSASFTRLFEAARQQQREKNKAAQAEKERQREKEAPGSGSPYARGHVRDFLNTHSPESRAVAAYCTPERTEQRKEVLHRQLLWVGRREAAEQAGREFTEPPPGRRPEAIADGVLIPSPREGQGEGE